MITKKEDFLVKKRKKQVFQKPRFSTEPTFKLLKSGLIRAQTLVVCRFVDSRRQFLRIALCDVYKKTDIFQKTLLCSFFTHKRKTFEKGFVAIFCTLRSKIYENNEALSKIPIRYRQKTQNFRKKCTLLLKKEEKTIGAQQKIFSRQARSL